MSDEQILEMLSDIVSDIDYDIYKDLFVEGYAEEPEMMEDNRKALVAIVKRHIGKDLNE